PGGGGRGLPCSQYLTHVAGPPAGAPCPWWRGSSEVGRPTRATRGGRDRSGRGRCGGCACEAWGSCALEKGDKGRRCLRGGRLTPIIRARAACARPTGTHVLGRAWALAGWWLSTLRCRGTQVSLGAVEKGLAGWWLGTPRCRRS